MKPQYRLVRMPQSDGPRNETQKSVANHNSMSDGSTDTAPCTTMNGAESPASPQTTEAPPAAPAARQADAPATQPAAPQPRRSHTVWWMLGTVGMALIVVVAVWMSHVSTSLTHANQLAASNAAGLGHVSNQLTGIQAQLAAIGQQLSQIENQIRVFFAMVMQHLH